MPRLSLRNLALVIAVAAGLCEAQAASPIGPEFLVSVSSDEFCDMTAARAAGLKDGGFVVTWMEGCFQSNDNILGRLYTDRGKRIGREFPVTIGGGDERNPSVARLTDGGFVVTWDSNVNDGHDLDVYGRRYNAAGLPVGGRFRVNSHKKGAQSFPSVARLTDGGFLVTWSSSQGGELDVYGQRYDAAGEPAGREFRANTYTENYQWNADVAGLTDGGFVVIWTSRDQDGSGDGLYGQRYRASGEPVGGEFRITAPIEIPIGGKVAGLKDGGFVVTWRDYRKDGESADVYGQRYTASGKPVGEEFRVNSYTAGYQAEGSVAGLKDGGFVVTWAGRGPAGDHSGIYGQQYDAIGERIGREFLIARKPAPGHAYGPSVAGLESGGFIVTWTKSRRQEVAVYGRLYDAK